MRKQPQSIRAMVIAMTLLCLAGLFSGWSLSAPAYAEGSGGSVPGENAPSDTTISPGGETTPGSGPGVFDIIELVVLLLGATM